MFMQVWVNQILTLKFHSNFASMQVWLNQILTPQNTTNMDFPLNEVNIFTFFILIQQLISN